MDKDKNKKPEEKSGLSPLSMPLDMFSEESEEEDQKEEQGPGEKDKKPDFAPEKKPAAVASPAAKKKEKEKPATPETDPVKKIYEIVDRRVAEQSSLKRADFPFGLILLAIFLSPFLFHLGSDLYFMGKQYVFSHTAAKPPVTDKEFIIQSARQNQKIISQLDSLIKTQKEMLQAGINKVVVINNEPRTAFSLKFEKQKIFEISGVDMDDPIKGRTSIGKVKSVDVLLELVDSFNRILLNAEHSGVSNLHIKNAVEGKKQALARLQELQ